MLFRAIWQRAKVATNGGDLPLSIRDELAHLQFHRIGSIVPILYFSIALVAVIAGTASNGGFDVMYHTVLPGGFILLGSYRCYVWYRRRGLKVSTAKVRRYLRSTTMIALAMGVVGGLWTVDAYNETVETRRVLAPVFIFMITFAGAICLTIMPRVAAGVMCVSLTPTLTIMVQSDDIGIQAMGICFTIVSLLTLLLIVNSFNEIVSGLVLRHELKALSETDPLTGLANRRAFRARFSSASGSAEAPLGVTLVMIDLDGFKEANDRYGHAAGDAILIQAGERLTSLCQDANCVARLGGDEFAVLIFDDGDCEALKRAVQTVLSLPYHYRDQQILISASVGMAHGPHGAISLETLMREADSELYRAKQWVSARRQASRSASRDARSDAALRGVHGYR
ncbi:diguanylate cyclase [Blastomonas sp.]|uniref:GGDEF domain-containing protein n=1 Tax=Blastomonas sp. TaxID=1909299 RepID=UPI0026198005|nr:diguanylate cyclase [Blastomonas sp.]MDM7957103.1 diguanylate cyclase [Blastomonas sp.]